MKSTLLKNFRSVLLAGFLSALAAASACAADNLTQIRSSGVLHIGAEGTYAPFTYHGAAGQLTGFDVEIGRAIAHAGFVRVGLGAVFRCRADPAVRQ
jgi:cystine transport system substrate-binding protein